MRAPKRKQAGPTKPDLRWQRMFLLTSAYVDEFKELPKHNGDYQDWAEDKWSEISKDSPNMAFPVEMQTGKLPHIGRWRQKQCKLYKEGKLPASRISELDTVPGWIWAEDHERTWQDKLNNLIEFVEEHGELPQKSTPKDNYKGGNLYKWMRRQREDYRDRLISTERSEQLEGIRGWKWDMRKVELKTDEWDAKCTLLKEYVGKYRNPRSIPAKDVIYKDVQLGRWCRTQRDDYRRGTLSNEKQRKLEAITGWYWKRDSLKNDPNWNYKLAVLKKFISEYGRLPRRNEVFQGIKLGSWCHHQRTFYRASELPSHRIEKLNKIPAWRWQLSFGRRKQQ